MRRLAGHSNGSVDDQRPVAFILRCHSTAARCTVCRGRALLLPMTSSLLSSTRPKSVTLRLFDRRRRRRRRRGRHPPRRGKFSTQTRLLRRRHHLLGLPPCGESATQRPSLRAPRHDSPRASAVRASVVSASPRTIVREDRRRATCHACQTRIRPLTGRRRPGEIKPKLKCQARATARCGTRHRGNAAHRRHPQSRHPSSGHRPRPS